MQGETVERRPKTSRELRVKLEDSLYVIKSIQAIHCRLEETRGFESQLGLSLRLDADCKEVLTPLPHLCRQLIDQ